MEAAERGEPTPAEAATQAEGSRSSRPSSPRRTRSAPLQSRGPGEIEAEADGRARGRLRPRGRRRRAPADDVRGRAATPSVAAPAPPLRVAQRHFPQSSTACGIVGGSSRSERGKLSTDAPSGRRSANMSIPLQMAADPHDVFDEATLSTAVAARAPRVVDSRHGHRSPSSSPTTPPVPPQNLEAEESVLGAMMLSPGAIGAVSEVLDASDFYRESHAKIYRAALALYAKGEPVDAITLADELEERGELEDGRRPRPRIHELAALVPATANAGALRADRPRDGDAARPDPRRRRDRRASAGSARARRPISSTAPSRSSSTSRSSASRASSRTSRTLLKESFERITALYEAGADVTGVAVRASATSTGSPPASSPAT